MSAKTKEAKQLARQVRKLGFRVEMTGNDHWGVYDDDDVLLVSFSQTPSDHYWRKKAIRDLQRAGIVL